MTQLITSRKNALMTQIRKLATSRSLRREQGLFLGDGLKLLAEAIRWGGALQTVVVNQGMVLPPLPPQVHLVEVPEDVMASISPMESPQGALFLCELPQTAPPETLAGGRYLVLDALQDPGNVGTIWRTADALGADGLILVNGCADPFSPKTVRATMGACFRLPIYEVEVAQLAPLLHRSQLPLYATALGENTVQLRQVKLPRWAVVIGSEGRGVSQELLQLSTQTLSIPMRERCESLNAAAAAAVVLWELGK